MMNRKCLTMLSVILCLTFWTSGVYAQISDEEHDYFELRVLAYTLTGPWSPLIVSLDPDPETRQMKITVENFLLEGSDMMCKIFANMMKYLTRTGWTVKIENKTGFIPGGKQVITPAAAKDMAEHDGLY